MVVGGAEGRGAILQNFFVSVFTHSVVFLIITCCCCLLLVIGCCRLLVVGGVVLMENMHLWMADAKTPAEREAWLTTLDRMAELQPERVIAGHFIGRTKADSRVIEFNREYLRTFNRLAGNSKTAAELIAGMKQAYPQLAEEKTLEFSAGVVKGDIRWPQ